MPSVFSITDSTAVGTLLYSNLRSANEGTYFVNVTFSGSEAAKWEAIYSSGTVVTLLSTSVPQPAPGILSAQFSNDGTYITIIFEADTNQGGLTRSFACSDLFAIYEVASGTAVSTSDLSCAWQRFDQCDHEHWWQCVRVTGHTPNPALCLAMISAHTATRA